MTEAETRASLELEALIPDLTVEDPLVVAKEECSWWSWLWKKPEPKFTKLSDIEYASSTGESTAKHKLDIYVPNTPSGADGSCPKRPVLIHVHGGGWIRGDKSHWFYGAPATGSAFASFNFVTVTVGYRTKIPFPGAIEDVADAISWVREHIGEEAYGGGDVERVFLSGHSAGGHLASLAAIDRRWLSRRNIPSDFIKGVVSISGIYNVADPLDSPLFSWGYNKIYITPTFGSDLDFMNDSSPLIHLNSIDTSQKHHIPPFFILNASTDLGLQKDGLAFHSAFLAKGLPVQYSILERETHGTISRSTKTMTAARDFLVGILANLASSQEDPLL